MRLELLLVVIATFLAFNGHYVNSSTVDVGYFKARIFSVVNSIRLQHATPELKYVPALDDSAQSYANELAIANVGVGRDYVKLKRCGSEMSVAPIDPMIRSGLDTCGESLMMINSMNLNQSCNPDMVVQIWNAQRLYYNYTSPPNDTQSQHQFADFTQLVWRNSKYIGVGYSQNIQNTTCYIVVRYYPAGNIRGEYFYNVSKGNSMYRLWMIESIGFILIPMFLRLGLFD